MRSLMFFKLVSFNIQGITLSLFNSRDMKIFAICVIVSLLVSVDSLSCPYGCYANRDEYCGPPPTCSSPLVYDVCGCCQVCSKIAGEECGGPWGIAGECAPGLECNVSGGTGLIFNRKGVCT